MKNVSITLYEFGELAPAARERAIHEQSIFLNEIDPQGRPFDVDESIDDIEANGYLFFADGSMACVTEYTGKHPRAGQVELSFHGQLITLS